MGLQDQVHIINGHKWFPFFIPQDVKGLSLLESYPMDTLQGKLCISFIVKTSSGRCLRLFSVFQSYLDFAPYQLTFPIERRCFFEYVLGQYTQKPRFDIDIDFENLQSQVLESLKNNQSEDHIDPVVFGEKLKDNVINNILKVLKSFGIELNLSKHICLYTSHGQSKRSYHVVISKFCHTTNTEAKSFYELVTNDLTELEKKFVDVAVYGKKQQFRCIGSQKMDSNRIKVFCEQWKYKDEIIQFEYDEEPQNDHHRMMMQFETSLLSCTINCTILPVFVNNAENDALIKRKFYPTCEIEITSEEAKTAFMMYVKSRKSEINHPAFPYRLGKIIGSIIILKRIRRSNCPICCRIHEHENPFLSIIGPEKTIFFNCRRKPSSSIFVGKLISTNLIVSDWLDETLASEGFSENIFNESDGFGENISNVSNSQSTLQTVDQVSKNSIRPSSPIEDKRLRRSFLFEAMAKSKRRSSNSSSHLNKSKII